MFINIVFCVSKFRLLLILEISSSFDSKTFHNYFNVFKVEIYSFFKMKILCYPSKIMIFKVHKKLLFFSRASVSQEGGIKNPRAKALWEKWRHVWVMAWERDRRLRDKLNYLQELENVKNFDWEEWRKRYLKFNNNKKSRVQDFFRKLDDDGDGYCPRDEFIDGILKNKFPSSKLEMNAVADKFDHGDGMIDWREFMVALRPDWEERGPLTDTQRIDDEIKRQVAQCTCRQKFKVFQVGEGKYRVSLF